MIFFSGFTCLVYQVLWMRQLGLLFGNTAHAAAVTLGVFFAGLAAGSWYWGGRVSVSRNPLRVYAVLEAGIAVTAFLFFWIISLFFLLYPLVYQAAPSGWLPELVKVVLALILIFPPAFFMGGTIPAMGQYLILRREEFGTTAARMYGVNTFGAALGALLVGFFSVSFFGFKITCGLAILISSLIAATAFWLSRNLKEDRGETLDVSVSRKSRPRGKQKRGKKKASGDEDLSTKAPAGIGRLGILALAFFSGFSVLALEVVWTRMFAQVHENSVYSFAAVLVIVLVCLSVGAGLAAWLAGLRVDSRLLLSGLLLLSGIVLGLSPNLFIHLTDNLTMLSTRGSFEQYFSKLFRLGFAGIAPPCLLLGIIFPFLMKSEQQYAIKAGKSIGTLAAVNTVGAVLGPLVCGFLLLPTAGMWRTVQMIAVVYVLASMLVIGKCRGGCWEFRITGGVVLLVFFIGIFPARLKVVGADPMRGRQEVREVWETSDCTVSVTEDQLGARTIKINSNYVLGSTGALRPQVFQSRIPLFIYPETRRIFFLGIGTGITAGGALDRDLFPSVRRVVACEMVSEVVEAARKYMANAPGEPDYTNGLFTDPRVTIVIEDGRHYLLGTGDTFDMINADLFLPYRSGAGSLYSREHFRRARRKLSPDGVFVQWLPLYQITDFEFGTICRTMLSVFDQVTLWRNNFQPGGEIAALIGHNTPAPLPACDLDMDEAKRDIVRGKDWSDLPDLMMVCNKQTVALFYCGNVTASKSLFDDYPVNTDDKPVIEYRAPISIRRKGDYLMPSTIVGPHLVELVDTLLRNCPPEHDPMLANRTKGNRRLPYAGAALHRAWVDYAMGNPEMCQKAWKTFVREWTNQR